PKEGLFEIAWLALEEEIRARFNQWRASRRTPDFEPSTIDAIAASGEDQLLQMPDRIKATLLRRLPPDFRIADGALAAAVFDAPLQGANHLYERHEGGLLRARWAKPFMRFFTSWRS